MQFLGDFRYFSSKFVQFSEKNKRISDIISDIKQHLFKRKINKQTVYKHFFIKYKTKKMYFPS